MKRIFGFRKEVQSGVQSLIKGMVASGRDMKQDSKQVVVSSNCQTGGIAAALQAIFPNDEIAPLPLPALSHAGAEAQFIEELKEAAVWVSIGGYELLEKHGLQDRIRLVRIPIIRFSGFHPDLVYARKASTKELIKPHYNSAIAIWAYKNNVDVNDAAKLFNEQSYTGLGYMDHWERSVAELKQRFKDTDLDFADFMLPMRREGVFMYSLNHPKVTVLTRLAKLAAIKMGASAKVLDRCIDINDGLNEVIWPVYPEIGENLSLPSGYIWKMGNERVHWISGVDAYLKYAYETYISQGIAPDDIVAAQADERMFDRVLGAQLGIKL